MPERYDQNFVAETTHRFNCITKFAFATSIGHQPGNPQKKNQDSYIIKPNIRGHLGLHLFSVCDGHGLNGHIISQFIKEQLPVQMVQ
jgi:serine/threonine protein phosphatase PrpC